MRTRSDFVHTSKYNLTVSSLFLSPFPTSFEPTSYVWGIRSPHPFTHSTIHNHQLVPSVFLSFIAVEMLRNPLIVESPFDPTNRFQTSSFVSPVVLACLRLLTACYSFSALFYRIGHSAAFDHSEKSRKSFSYFTNLSYWGIACYFAVAAFHTGVYALRGRAPLQKWGKVLQWLHSLLYTTVVTLPFLVYDFSHRASQCAPKGGLRGSSLLTN
jgi:hypothetical protein